MACNLPYLSSLKPDMAAGICVLCQACVALWIWSVWSWRLRLKTAFRPGQAEDLLSEFRTYGYGEKFMKTIGLVKLSCASILGAGIVFDDYVLTIQAASLVFIGLMLGALVSHARVGSTRFLAALIMASMGTFVFAAHYFGCASDVEQSSSMIESVATPMRRNLIGGFVMGGCAFMWLSSYMRGDYNLSQQ